MKVTVATIALVFIFSTVVPSVAADFSGGSPGVCKTPNGGVSVGPSFRDARSIEVSKLAPDDALRVLPLDAASVVEGLAARGISVDGKELVLEPSESLRAIVTNEYSGGLVAEKTPGPLSALEPALEGERTVFGSDDRVAVTNTSQFPFCAVGQLLVTLKSGGTGTCSGALIGPRTVLTAAHCLYNHDDGGWAADIQYVPGRRGSADHDAPYGAFEWQEMHVLKGYIDNYEGSYDSVFRWDLGLLVLKEPVGESLGWLGYGHYEGLGTFTAHIAGYPGDMPAGTMWFVSCDAQGENITADYFQYHCDTFPGSSGSAVYALDDNNKRVIVGVNVAETPNENTAVRLNAAYLAWVNDLNQ